jgi:cephalosporin hydroxylase
VDRFLTGRYDFIVTRARNASTRARSLERIIRRPTLANANQRNLNLSPRPFTTDIPKPLLDKIQTGTMQWTYKGIPTYKNPFDLALYAKLLWDVKPRTIIEIGSNAGGSAVWFADQVRAMQLGAQIYSLDINPVLGVTDPLVTFQTADVHQIADAMPPTWVASLPRPLFVIEDSAHTYEATLHVMRHFADLLQHGEYLAVEDSIVTPLGIDYDYTFNGGPARAIQQFLEERADFIVDTALCDYFGFNVTYNVNGYLRKVAPGPSSAASGTML